MPRSACASSSVLRRTCNAGATVILAVPGWDIKRGYRWGGPRQGLRAYRGDRVALGALPSAILDHHLRVEEVDLRRRTDLLLHERPPLTLVEPIRVRARGPHVDAAGTAAVLADVEVLGQQAG